MSIHSSDAVSDTELQTPDRVLGESPRGHESRDDTWRARAPMKTFYHLLGNTIIASVTNFTVWFAITFFVYLETRSVAAMGVVSGLFLVATASSGIWFGSLVDHHRKKHVMLLSSVVSLAIYIIGLVIYLASPPDAFAHAGSIILWIFVPVLMIGVIAGNLRGIALPTVITTMFSEDARDKANGMAGTATGISFLTVSVISGILVGLAGMYWVLLLAIALTIAAIIHLWTIKVPEQETQHTDAQPQRVDLRGTLKAISMVSGLLALIVFATFNNFLGGVFMALMDAYGLSLVTVEVWGLLWGIISIAFIIGGLIIARRGLGKNPLRTLFLANITIWAVSSIFTIQPSILLLSVGLFIYLGIVPYIEAAEHTIIQKVVPPERQGRVFGFAQSVEQAASPFTSFAIGPITQIFFIPFMTTGAGARLIGDWYGSGPDRGIALVFTLAGITGLCVTVIAMRTKYYRQLSAQYLKGVDPK